MGGTMEELYVETIAKVGNRHICLFLLEHQQDFYLSSIMLQKDGGSGLFNCRT